MTDPTSYRDLACRTLEKAGQALNEMPQGMVSAAEIQSRSARAQAIATVAAVQALIEIGDVLRAALRQPGGAS
ncbi:hypothetical protein ACH4UM_23990 [Streptomyces sp. NPDC020801]|uniref:hypothetical protein n=1 Tax=Streptomyces sp. NPDC020801 TaxID=3365093 RepID=UPI00379264D2